MRWRAIMDKVKIVKALAPLQLGYKREFDQEQLAFYVEMLCDLDPELIYSAVKKIICKSKFLPSVAEIRESCESISSTATGNRPLNADEAWGIVMKAVKDTPPYEHPKFDSEAITETVNNIGWQTIYEMLATEQSIIRAQFRDFYNLAVKRKSEAKTNTNIIMALPDNSRLKSLLQKVTAKSLPQKGNAKLMEMNK